MELRALPVLVPESAPSIPTFSPQRRQSFMRIASALFFGTLALTANLWSADPFIGVWKLNPAKSKFEPGPAPQSLLMTWTNDDSGATTIHSEGVRADGKTIQETYVAIYDGNERKKPGPWNFDAVINRRISENEREDVFKKGGTTVGTSRLVVSADGRVLTITWKYGELRDVRMFDKQ